MDHLPKDPAILVSTVNMLLRDYRNQDSELARLSTYGAQEPGLRN